MDDVKPRDQITSIENQCHVLLYVSGVNLICNILTIFVAVMFAG